jgi:hypothetical protein
MKDNSPFVFAGLWEAWKVPANDEWLHTVRIELVVSGMNSREYRTDTALEWVDALKEGPL